MLAVALDEPLSLCEWALGRVEDTGEAVSEMLAAKELADEAGCDFEDVLLD
jgi:hypothetical protein